MDKKKILNRLDVAEKYFGQTKYQSIVILAQSAFQRGNFKLCASFLDQLPSKKDLLASLIKKLKGKSVHHTLQKIQKGNLKNDYVTLKGLSSLFTHILISCEQGDREYSLLIPVVLEEINERIYNII